jgi:hypothetical protein
LAILVRNLDCICSPANFVTRQPARVAARQQFCKIFQAADHGLVARCKLLSLDASLTAARFKTCDWWPHFDAAGSRSLQSVMGATFYSR